MSKKVYFIGIAGKAMGQLAKAFKDLGWEVGGSDQQGVYPPISTYLKQNKIPYTEGYVAKNVPSKVDLIVVGRSALMVDPKNPEYLRALKLNCPVLSYPEVLKEHLIKKNSIVIAGTYGKTTISAIVAWILTKAGFNPSYMTGGIPLNLGDGVKITSSNYSVVEGDEPPALFETDLPKFMFYQPKYLVLTATKHDHPEVFKTVKAYERAFYDLISLLPKEGMLVYNLENVNAQIVKTFKGKKVSYSLKDQKADYFVKNILRNKDFTRFTIAGKRKIDLSTRLIGDHNLENVCAAVVLCLELNEKIDLEKIKEAISLFSGIKTRLEFLGKIGGRFLYWDLAQHPAKVKGTLQALRQHYPKQKILCIFDPSMTGLKHRESLSWYNKNFDQADRVVIARVGFLSSLKGDSRVCGADIVKAIRKSQKNVYYEPDDKKIIDLISTHSRKDEIIVFMSSGGLRFTKLIQESIKQLKKQN